MESAVNSAGMLNRARSFWMGLDDLFVRELSVGDVLDMSNFS